jgi:hypothetical protein
MSNSPFSKERAYTGLAVLQRGPRSTEVSRTSSAVPSSHSRLFREFPLGERRHLQFRADMFNIANLPVWGSRVSNYNDPQFGKIRGTRSTARQVQFAMRFLF